MLFEKSIVQSPQSTVRTARKALWLAAAAAALATIASCGFLSSIFGRQEAGGPRPFPHAKHLIPEEAPEDVKGARLTCKACHKGIETGESAKMMPAGMKACTKCHDEEEYKKQLAFYFDDAGKPRGWGTLSAAPEEVKFDHLPHLSKKVDCLECHTGIDKNLGLIPSEMPLRMNRCTVCHQQRARPGKRECTTCHEEIDKDRPPPSHRRLWKNRHGQAWREGVAASTGNDCSLCHTSDTCVTCHQTRRPDDHNVSWKFQPHGIAAGIDRSRCQNCHSSDFCVRCHQQTAPRSHSAGWDAPRNLHCVSCHLETAQESCFVCHKTAGHVLGAPAHELAPPKPAWHTPGMVCRSCHGGTLPHADDGDDCNRCHR